MIICPAYRLVLPDTRSSSVVFASPHSGRAYDAAFLRASVLDERAIRSSEDAFTDLLYADAPGFGAPLLQASAPRSFVDMNRSAEELDPALIEGAARVAHNPRISSGLGVVPRVVAGGRAIYRGKMPLAEAQARITRYWRPYHAALQGLLDESLAGFGAADIALGSQSQAGFARATSADVAKAAFALPVGGISAPIKSQLGWHVVRAASLGSAGKTLAQARPAIEAELNGRAVDDAVAGVVAGIEDGVEAGKSFADIAKDAVLTIQTQGAVTQQGTAPGQPPLAGDQAAVAGRAFKHEPADGPVVDDLGGGRLVVIETAAVLPAAPPPIADVMPLAIAAAAQDKAMKVAKAKAEAVVAATKKGTSFAKAVADAGLGAPRPLNGRRIDIVGQQQVPDAARAFLNGAAGSTQLLAGQGGWIIVHVDRIVPGDPKAQAGLIEASRREVGSALPGEMAEGLAKASMAAVGVSRNDATLRKLRQRLTGDGVQ